MAARNHQKRIAENKRRVDASHLRFREPKILDHLRAGDRHDGAIEVTHHAEAEQQGNDNQLRRIETSSGSHGRPHSIAEYLTIWHRKRKTEAYLLTEPPAT